MIYERGLELILVLISVSVSVKRGAQHGIVWDLNDSDDICNESTLVEKHSSLLTEVYYQTYLEKNY